MLMAYWPLLVAPERLRLLGTVVAMLCALEITLLGYREIQRQRDRQQADNRERASAAYQRGLKCDSISALLADEDFIRRCAELAIGAQIKHPNEVRKCKKNTCVLRPKCQGTRCDKPQLHQKLMETRMRARFYSNLSADDLKFYLPTASRKDRVSQMVALLTEFPARWIMECGENRHGKPPFDRKYIDAQLPSDASNSQ
jgi:hypothetical protein